MELLLHVVVPCEVHAVIRFFTTKNKSAVGIYREVCSVYGNCMSIFPMNFNSWFVLGGKKMNNCTHLTAAPFSLLCSVHFCQAIVTQLLYLPTISR